VIILNKKRTPPVIKSVFRVHNNSYKNSKSQFKYKTIIPKKIQRDQVTQSNQNHQFFEGLLKIGNRTQPFFDSCFKEPSFQRLEWVGLCFQNIKIRGVSHCGLAIYIKKYLKAKEELLNFIDFTMQKHNLQKTHLKETKSSKIS
jgi:predicted RNA-binding protein